MYCSTCGRLMGGGRPPGRGVPGWVALHRFSSGWMGGSYIYRVVAEWVASNRVAPIIGYWLNGWLLIGWHL